LVKRRNKKGACGIGLNNWWMDYPDPFDFISGMLSKSTAINQGSNPSFWWDPKIETDLGYFPGAFAEQ
jgi:hypothetical protein